MAFWGKIRYNQSFVPPLCIFCHCMTALHSVVTRFATKGIKTLLYSRNYANIDRSASRQVLLLSTSLELHATLVKFDKCNSYTPHLWQGSFNNDFPFNRCLCCGHCGVIWVLLPLSPRGLAILTLVIPYLITQRVFIEVRELEAWHVGVPCFKKLFPTTITRKRFLLPIVEAFCRKILLFLWGTECSVLSSLCIFFFTLLSFSQLTASLTSCDTFTRHSAHVSFDDLLKHTMLDKVDNPRRVCCKAFGSQHSNAENISEKMLKEFSLTFVSGESESSG